MAEIKGVKVYINLYDKWGNSVGAIELEPRLVDGLPKNGSRKGELVLNTQDSKLYFWDGSAWKKFAIDPHAHVRADITDFFSSPFWDNIPDKPDKFPPEEHTHPRSDITDFFASPFWDNIPDKPDKFPPELHASTHAKGGVDEISIDASQVTSGVLDYARIPDLNDVIIASSGRDIINIRALKFSPETGTKIREAEATGDGYWVGAPSVYYDSETGEFWLTYRRRNPTDRGYRLVIAKSTDGVNFTDVWSADKGDFGAESLERATLFRHPITGKYHLIVGLTGIDGDWRIYALDPVDDPTLFDPATTSLVLDVGTSGEWDDSYVKDPKVICCGGLLIMLYVGKTTTGNREERGGIAYSIDGVNWTKYANNPIIDVGTTWDSWLVKPNSMLNIGNCCLLYYSGTAPNPPYSCAERIGLYAWTPLTGFVKLTPDSPFLQSPYTNYHCKYMDVVVVGNKAYFYYELGQDTLEVDLYAKVVNIRE